MVTEKQKRHIQKRKICGFIDLSASERLPQIVNSYFVKLGSKRKSVRGKVVVAMPPELPDIVVRVGPLNKKYGRQRPANVSTCGKLHARSSARVTGNELRYRGSVIHHCELSTDDFEEAMNTATDSTGNKKSK